MVREENEQDLLMRVFTDMLRGPTGDGKKKRERGEKPPWWRDEAHMAAVWSHFRKRERGELVDPESGEHPFVHAAWRLLAIAFQETYGKRDPRGWWRDGERTSDTGEADASAVEGGAEVAARTTESEAEEPLAAYLRSNLSIATSPGDVDRALRHYYSDGYCAWGVFGCTIEHTPDSA